MRETWLHANPKAVWPLLLVPTLLVVGGLGGAAWCVFQNAGPVAWTAAGVCLLAGATPWVTLWRWSRLPRLAYEEGELLVFLDKAIPERVPIEVVECFFRGTGETLLPGAKGDVVKTSTIIVRLAEAAGEWHARASRHSIGAWADGYITLRGTWCEPITPDLLRRLNARLVLAHREQSGDSPCGGGSTCSTEKPCSGSRSHEQPGESTDAVGGCEL